MAVTAGLPTDLWTCPRVSWLIQHRFGVHYHPAHVSRLLHGLGFSPQKRGRLCGRLAKLWDAGISANVAVRREAFMATGGFDGQVRTYEAGSGALLRAFTPVPITTTSSQLRSGQ